MQSFLIIAKNAEKRDSEIKKLLDAFGIGQFDIVEQTGNIGVEEVRNLHANIFLAPLTSPNKAVVVKIDAITTEAQNALLKILEEPPPHTIIILTASTSEIFLPTILSRCFVIEQKEQIKSITETKQEELESLIAAILSQNIGAKLKLAQDYGKNREEAVVFLEEFTIIVRQNLLTQIEETAENHLLSHYLSILVSIQKSYTLIKTTNVSPRFALETLFLSL